MDSETASLAQSSNWRIPLVFIGAVIIWLFLTWIKWSLLQKRQNKYAMENKQLQDLLRFDSISGKTAAEALKAFHERQEGEERAKFAKTGGRTLVEEIDERRRIKEEEMRMGKKPKANPRKYTPEMFEDSGSRIWNEMMKKKEMEKNAKYSQEMKEEEEDAKNNNNGPQVKKRGLFLTKGAKMD